MGELQLTLLYRMSTGWYDQKGLSVLTGIRSCGRIIPRLVETGHIEWMSIPVEGKQVLLYRRTKRGRDTAHDRNTYHRQESRETCEACGSYRKRIVE